MFFFGNMFDKGLSTTPDVSWQFRHVKKVFLEIYFLVSHSLISHDIMTLKTLGENNAVTGAAKINQLENTTAG